MHIKEIYLRNNTKNLYDDYRIDSPSSKFIYRISRIRDDKDRTYYIYGNNLINYNHYDIAWYRWSLL